MKYALFAILISIAAFCPDGLAQSVEGMDYISESVATTDRATAGIHNPAGLAFWSAMGLHYSHSFTDSSYKGDDGALLSSRSSFFAIEWLNHGNNIFRRKYTAAMGDRIFQNFYAGISYSWFASGNELYKGKKDWKFGLMYHPRPFSSFGLVVDRINEPRLGGFRQKRLYQPGVAIRPLGETVTFSVDGRWLEGEDITTLNGTFRLAAGPFHGLNFVADYRTEGQLRFGVSVDFQQTRVGGQGRTTGGDRYDGGTYYAEVTSLRAGSAIPKQAQTGLMTLKDDITEEPRQRPLFGPGKRSLYSVIKSLRQGADDPRIGSLMLNLDGVALDFARAQELRGAISEYRANGKKVTVFINRGGNLEYYLASAADEIYMEPSGLLELKGLAATARFYKGTMDKLGIRAEVVRTGPHKSFGDAYTETGLTEAAREEINWLLDDLYAQFVDGISSGRRIQPEKVKTLIDAGPYTALDAYEAGLVDGLKHFDELSGDEVKDSVAQVSLERFFSIEDYNPRWAERQKIAIVYADGAILPGKSGSSLLEGRTVGSETLSKALRRIRRDGSIKAVVFRVNSPGGDVFASEEIYRELELLKGKKPIVVSMAGVAASGGYYIAAPGDQILAQPGTITGSIGVVMGKVDMSGFYEKIGVSNETITRGKHADIRTTTRPATAEEIELTERMIWQYYDDFISKVATWRPLDQDSVDAVGQGRVWTGRQALERGLVDAYGGLWEAVELACQKAKIDPRDRLEVVSYPVYGISILPSLGVPSLEAQLGSLLEEGGRQGYYFKSPIDLTIK